MNINTLITTKQKIYIAIGLGAVFAAVVAGGAALTDHRIASAERAVDVAREAAASSEARADEQEKLAAAYSQKIDYLDGQLAQIQQIARKQDEQLQKLNITSRDARNDVAGARNTRTVAATADQLCAKLAELGHGCGPE